MLTVVAGPAGRALSAGPAVTDAQPLPIRIVLAGAAALCAVLVPGQAAKLMERPLRVPQWRRAGAPVLARTSATG
jgi:hypothetical protein